MNRWLFASGVISLLLMLIHAFVGGPEVHEAVLVSDLEPLAIAVLTVVWHATTAFMLVNGVLLIWGASRERYAAGIALVVIGQYASFTLLFLYCSLAQLGNLVGMPQWIAFAIVSGCIAMGLRRAPCQYPTSALP